MITIKVYKGSNTSSEFKTYNLDNDKLKTFETYNDFMSVNEKGEYTIERWIHINEYGGYKIEKKIEKGKIEDFSLYEGINVIEIDSRRSQTEIIYIIENPYTKAMGVEIKNKIQINNQGIMQEVSKKVGKEEIISSINQSPEEIKLKASKIKFEGMVTANNNVSIDENGFIKAKGIFDERGSFTTLYGNGYEKTVNIGENGVDILDSDFHSIEQNFDDGERSINYYLHNAIHLNLFMPKGFTPIDIRIILEHKPRKWFEFNGDYICDGNTKAVCIYKHGEFETFQWKREQLYHHYYERFNENDRIKDAFGTNKTSYTFNGNETIQSRNLINDLIYDKDTTKDRVIKAYIGGFRYDYVVSGTIIASDSMGGVNYPDEVKKAGGLLSSMGKIRPQIVAYGYYKDIGGN